MPDKIERKELQEAIETITRQLEYFEGIEDEPWAKPKCFLQHRVGGECHKCKICPLFVSEDRHKKAPHPCWHIQNEKGVSIWMQRVLLEEGLITQAQYNLFFNTNAPPVMMIMRQGLLNMLENYDFIDWDNSRLVEEAIIKREKAS